MLGECQVNIKSQSELVIGGRETCYELNASFLLLVKCLAKEWWGISDTVIKASVLVIVDRGLRLELEAVHSDGVDAGFLYTWAFKLVTF